MGRTPLSRYTSPSPLLNFYINLNPWPQGDRTAHCAQRTRNESSIDRNTDPDRPYDALPDEMDAGYDPAARPRGPPV